jgi:hypothetical protein
VGRVFGNIHCVGAMGVTQQEHKEHEQKLSLKSLSSWSGFGTWRGFYSFDLCLGVNALALVLNVKC